jgi:hypothetical protein
MLSPHDAIRIRLNNAYAQLDLLHQAKSDYYELMRRSYGPRRQEIWEEIQNIREEIRVVKEAIEGLKWDRELLRNPPPRFR